MKQWSIAVAVAAVYLIVSLSLNAWRWSWLIWGAYAVYRLARTRGTKS